MDPSVSTGENPDSNENNPQESEFESNNSCGDALGKALSTMLATVIKDLDSKAQDTLNSQDKLNSAIDRLTRELDQLLEDAPLSFIMQHATKISGVRKRVLSLNSVLKSIQKRVDNIERLLFVGMLQDVSQEAPGGGDFLRASPTWSSCHEGYAPDCCCGSDQERGEKGCF
ncbi:hypothetical protein Peur_043357 [Populus x canadensis]